ncbi:dormancy-associated protein homolog 4-like [Momordica charantia]|uniref:Dormancy-associated protein homolog 4-like n=1 Tax=Momordica charantia TaxID=3673 RepID=A0A6J1DF61_MOMCH|nr:dormancy-associated protein homolog 4-like [Momordica charantia]
MTSFLHKLWDETVAGPTPDTGLGKLRKYDSISPSELPPIKISDEIPVTRSITILRRNSDFRTSSEDRHRRMPDSIAGISSPRTPVTPGTPEFDLKRFSWRKSSAESSEHDG